MKKYEGWIDMKTRQSKQLLKELVDAKKNRRALLIINDTGMGKTHTVETFAQVEKKYTYVVTVGYSFKLPHVIEAIMDLLGIDIPTGNRYSTTYERLQLIADELQRIHNSGGNPVIILDEAENLQPAVLKAIKELYDYVIKYCSIVLIGTSYIMESMLNTKKKNRMSVPQLYRRFKAGIRHIVPLHKAKDFVPFFEAHEVPTDVQDVVLQLANNYGELHDYLHPYLQQCAELGQEPAAKTFRLYHSLPADKKVG